jgi:hypothetical protein
MQTEVQGDTRGIGHGGALVHRHSDIGVARHYHADAAVLKLAPQAAGKRQRDGFFLQPVAQQRPAIIAPVSGVEHDNERQSGGERLQSRRRGHTH